MKGMDEQKKETASEMTASNTFGCKVCPKCLEVKPDEHNFCGRCASQLVNTAELQTSLRTGKCTINQARMQMDLAPLDNPIADKRLIKLD